MLPCPCPRTDPKSTGRRNISKDVDLHPNANRQKDPLHLFAALQRQLGYPEVPRLKPFDNTSQLTTQLARRMEQLEGRIRLLEEEQRGGIDLSKFFHGEFPLPDSSDPAAG